MDYEIKKEDLINARDRFLPIIGQKKKPLMDEEISKIVGKPIMINDPKLIALVAKFKKMKSNPDEPDRLLQNSQFIKELKETFI